MSSLRGARSGNPVQSWLGKLRFPRCLGCFRRPFDPVARSWSTRILDGADFLGASLGEVHKALGFPLMESAFSPRNILETSVL